MRRSDHLLAAAVLLTVQTLATAAAPTPGARTLLITCPIASRTEVRPLSAKSLAPLSAATSPPDRAETAFIAWAYAVPPNPDARACEGGDVVPFGVGDTLAIPGSSGASLTRTTSSINVTLGGATGVVPLPPRASVVTACARGPLHTVLATPPASAGSGDALQLVFNADTGCFVANAVEVGSVQGADSAEPTDDASVAARAGVPLPADYSPPSAPPAPAPLANPCLSPDAGTSPGLTNVFYTGAAATNGKLAFEGATRAAARCDCPNHRAPGACGRGPPPSPPPWPPPAMAPPWTARCWCPARPAAWTGRRRTCSPPPLTTTLSACSTMALRG